MTPIEGLFWRPKGQPWSPSLRDRFHELDRADLEYREIQRKRAEDRKGRPVDRTIGNTGTGTDRDHDVALALGRAFDLVFKMDDEGIRFVIVGWLPKPEHKRLYAALRPHLRDLAWCKRLIIARHGGEAAA